MTPTEPVAFTTDGEIIVGGVATTQVPGNDMICLPTLACGPTTDMADAAGLSPDLLPNRRSQGSPSFPLLLPTPARTDRSDVNVFHWVRPPWYSLKVLLTMKNTVEGKVMSTVGSCLFYLGRGNAVVNLFGRSHRRCDLVPPPDTSDTAYFRFRHSHGGSECRSAHKPFFASRASFSNPSSVKSPGAYFPYHQHQPSLTSV